MSACKSMRHNCTLQWRALYDNSSDCRNNNTESAWNERNWNEWWLCSVHIQCRVGQPSTSPLVIWWLTSGWRVIHCLLLTISLNLCLHNVSHSHAHSVDNKCTIIVTCCPQRRPARRTARYKFAMCMQMCTRWLKSTALAGNQECRF